MRFFTYSLMFIRPNTRDNNDILFSALKSIHTGDLNVLIQFRMQLSLVLHVLYQISSLSFIRCNDSNLFRIHSSFDESEKKSSKNLARKNTPKFLLCSQFLHIGRFSSVQVRRSGSRNLFLSVRHVKEHGLIRLRPRKLHQKSSFIAADTILQ